MKYVIKILTSIIIILIFVGCSETDSMFKRHVLDDDFKNVDEIHYGKMNCMNCPMYFYFKAPNKIITKIVKVHRLKEIKSIPTYVTKLNIKINNEVTWWIKNIDLNNVQIYLVLYVHKTEEVKEPNYRVMLVDSNNIYFITKGYFNENEYKEGTVSDLEGE
jgi:hypothetical protein